MKTFVLESLFNNLQDWVTETLLKRDSKTGVFLWNLRNFKNTYFEEYLLTTAPVFIKLWYLRLNMWEPIRNLNKQ